MKVWLLFNCLDYYSDVLVGVYATEQAAQKALVAHGLNVATTHGGWSPYELLEVEVEP